MMNRREVNRTLFVTLAALFAGGSASGLKAEAAVASLGIKGHAQVAGSDPIRTLIREPLAKMKKPVVDMITLTMPPGAASSPHQHTGPVFAYILEGELENQVEPGQPKKYKPGDFFYEPPRHIHRIMRNLSSTKELKLLIVQIEEQGVPFTIAA